MRTIIGIFLTLWLISWGQASAQESQLLATTDASQDAILIIDPAQGVLKSIVVGDGVHTVWGFSPDGCHVLATLTQGDGLPKAYSVSLMDNSAALDLIQYDELPASQWGAWEPTWSPDGARVAFTLIRDGFEGEPGRTYHVAWVTPEGGVPQTYSATGREHSPQWSPDGQWLAYVSYDLRDPDDTTPEPERTPTPGETDRIAEADLWVVAADASVKYRLTAFPEGSIRAPRWSPDGQTIAFTFSPSPSNDTYWAVRNSPRSRPFQITFGNALSLDQTWTPSGDLLVSARGIAGQTSHRLWQIPADVNGEANLAEFGVASQLPFPDYASFNDAGTHLALRSGYRAAVVDLSSGTIQWIVGADGNMPIHWSSRGTESLLSCGNSGAP